MTEVFDAFSESEIFALKETTYGTVPSVPAATDALRVLNLNSLPADEQIPNEESGQGRSRPPAVVGATTVNVNCQTYLRAGATATADTEIDLLLENLFGTKSVNPGVQFTLAKRQTKSLCLFQTTDAVQEAVVGVAFNNGTFTWGGRQLSTLALTGQGRQQSLLTPFTASGSDDFRDLVGVGNIISIDGGAAAAVTSVVAGTVAPAISSGDVITSGLPTGTFPNVLPHYGTIGSLSLDGGTTTVNHRNGSITVGNGVQLQDGIYGTTGPTAVQSPARRNIQISLTFDAATSDIRRIQQIRRNTFYDVVLNVGPSTGRYEQFDMSQVQFTPPGIQRNIDATSTITLTGQATAKAGERDMEFVYRRF